ncbi:hypothetical protein JCM5350_000204 [Sporobolomyces pararoseus]
MSIAPIPESHKSPFNMHSPSLPPELVSEILLFALPSPDPHTFSASTYQERVDLLSEFSLVSRTFRNVADPILYSTFWARNSRQLKSFLRSVKAKGIANRVHRLVLGFDRGQISKSQVVSAAKVLTSINELSLSNVKLEDVTVLNRFKELQSLTLDKVSHNSKTFFTLPHLKDLTVGQKCAIDLSTMEDQHAPQLSALALRRKTNLKAWTPSLSSTTPWNLQAFVLDWDESYRWNSPLPNVLVNLHLEDGHYADAIPSILGSGVLHLRIYLGPLPLHLDSHLNGIRNFVQNNSTPLETLFVPSYLDPDCFSSASRPEDETMVETAQKLKNLAEQVVDECVARKIDLIFEDQPDGKFDSDVSKAFLRKMEVAKRQREAQSESVDEVEKV